MTFLKKYILRISLIFALVVSAFLCIYTTVNYKTNTHVTQNRIEQNNSFKEGGGQNSDDLNQMPSGQNSSQNMAPAKWKSIRWKYARSKR